MAAVYEIPIIDAPSQRIETVLNYVPVSLLVDWNEWAGWWSLGLDVRGAPTIRGLRMVPERDFLKPYSLGLGKLALLQWVAGEAAPGRSEVPSGLFRLLHYADAVA
jgi:hypothetical protein